MASRMSNRDRIQQKAEEAAAAEKEKKEKKSKPTTARKTTRKSKKKTSASVERQKVVWKVFNANFKEVACFPYAEKAKAEAEATALSKKLDKSHFVNAVKVPFDES
jgi:hypothetical protein